MKKLGAFSTLFMALIISLSFSVIAGASLSIATEKPQTFLPITLALFSLSIVIKSKKGALYVTFTEGICEKVQSSLIEIMGKRAPSLHRTQTGYLQALTSPQNMAGMSIVPIDPGTGKLKQVRIKYIQRGTSDDLVTTKPTGCTTTLEKSPFEATITVDNYIGTAGLKFNEAEMRKLCEADSEFMAGVINAEIDPLVVAIDKELITIQSTNFGYFPGTTSSAVKSVKMLNAATDNSAVYDGEATILEDIEAMDGMDKPLVIGSGKLARYVRNVGIGCCNDLGQEIGQAGNLDFFRDRFVGTILGNADDFISILPGHFQLLTYNEYVGSYAKENQVFSHGTILDPVSGLTFDMKWHYNDCDDFYFVQIGLHYDLFVMPSNVFAYGDELNGVNFSLHYRATAA